MIPLRAQATLAKIPARFKDDGCSNVPDSIFGWELGWCCRIHDWRYCGRCHPPGSMTWGAKVVADEELKDNMRAALPWRWRWLRYIYKAGVFLGGGYGSWDSCTDEPPGGASLVQRRTGLCRHNMPKPEWMTVDNAN